MGKVFHVILEVIHLLNGMFQNVHERYTANEVVEHKFFSNILHRDNRFFKAFQKQATVTDGQRVCLFCLKLLFYLSHCKRLLKSLVEVSCKKFLKNLQKHSCCKKSTDLKFSLFKIRKNLCGKYNGQEWSFPVRNFSVNVTNP